MILTRVQSYSDLSVEGGITRLNNQKYGAELITGTQLCRFRSKYKFNLFFLR